MSFHRIARQLSAGVVVGLLASALMAQAGLPTSTVPAAPTAPLAKSPVASSPDSVMGSTGKRAKVTRVQIDSAKKVLRQAQQAKLKGDWVNARTGMLDAAIQFKQIGFEHDQITVLRDMTLEPTVGKPESVAAYVRAGQQAMAEFYYTKYLNTKPRAAQWLLEALAWANYADDEALLTRFAARVPNKEHENIDERGRQRGKELKSDDALFLAFEEIRLNNVETVKATLAAWPYSIDMKHSLLGTSLLHTAVWYNKPDTVKLLIEQFKANVNVEDNDKGKDTPLDYAYHQQFNELVTYLKSKGGKTNNYYQQKSAAAPQEKSATKP